MGASNKVTPSGVNSGSTNPDHQEEGAKLKRVFGVLDATAHVTGGIIGSANADEGQQVAYSALAYDPGSDVLTYEWLFNYAGDPAEFAQPDRLGSQVDWIFPDKKVLANLNIDLQCS